MILDAANAVMVQFNFDAGNLTGNPNLPGTEKTYCNGIKLTHYFLVLGKTVIEMSFTAVVPYHA